MRPYKKSFRSRQAFFAMQTELEQLRKQLAAQQLELGQVKASKARLTRQGRTGLVLMLVITGLLLIMDGLGNGQPQALAQVQPQINSQGQLNGLASVPSASLPKFCPFCYRPGITYPVNLDLNGAYLVGANYSYSNLTGAYFFYANLTDISLDNAVLENAHLVNTDLSQASMTHTFLYQALLTNANLYKADLSSANLLNADLTNANLFGVTTTGLNDAGVIYNNTICPDGTNSNSHSNTCSGHGMP
jgi:hypothetical protein